LVHLHDSLYLGNVAAFVWACLFGKPVVVTQHIGSVPYTQRLPRWLHALANRTLGRWLLGSCARCVFISQKVQAFFSRFVRFRREPRFIANGVATNTFRPVGAEVRQCQRSAFGWPVDMLILLFVGRFVEKKNLGLMRRLAAHFSD